MNEKLMIQVTQELLSTFCYVLNNNITIILFLLVHGWHVSIA